MISKCLKSEYKKHVKESDIQLFDEEGYHVTREFSEYVKVSSFFKNQPVLIDYTTSEEGMLLLGSNNLQNFSPEDDLEPLESNLTKSRHFFAGL